jgi:hypothetical protein
VIDWSDQCWFLTTSTFTVFQPKYERPEPKMPVFFHEPFDSKEDFKKR